MSEKNTVSVVIGKKVIRLSGYESEDYLQQVAAYLNHKIAELGKSDGYRRMTSDMQSSLLSLNVADDYFKAKKQAESFEEDIKAKDASIYELKQKIVDLEMTNEELRSNLRAQPIKNGSRVNTAPQSGGKK